MKPRPLGRMLMKILVLSTILTMLVSPLAIAPSHPMELIFDQETGETKTIDTILGNEWKDPGITPDSFWYGLELWYEKNIEKPPEDEQLAERLAEAHVELTAGNVEAAGKAMGEAQTGMNVIQTEVESVEGDADNFDDYVEHIERAVALGEQVDALTYEFEQAISTGAVPADSPIAEVVEISLDTLQDGAAAVGNAVADLREEIVDNIAEEQGITHIEAENMWEDQEEEAGVATIHELAVRDELAEVQEELTALRESIDTAQAAGETVDTATLQLLHEATAHFEHAQEAIEDGNFGQAFGQLTASEHITENAEDHLEQQEEIPPELEPDTIREERLAEVREFLEEAPPLLAANPDDPELTVLTDNVQVLQQELQVEDKVTELLAAGKLPEEVYEAAAPEIAHIFGRTDYIPPVFTEAGGEAASRLADFESVAANLQTAGGFVEGFLYVDPASGYTHEFTENGYKYTTPFGTEHKVNFPEGFSSRIPDAFSKGTEQHPHTAPDGTKYTYTSLGYTVSKPDGTTESFAYPTGEFGIPGGYGKIEIDPQGLAVYNDRGRIEGQLAFVPEFDTYVAGDGSVYNPESFGFTSIHDEAINYDYDKHTYVFDPDKVADFFSRQYEQIGFIDIGAPGPGPTGLAGPGRAGVKHDEWSYDPVTSLWTNTETAESRKAEATMVAPVGHEDKGSYSTEYGETWTYDAATRGWTSEKGETFTSEGEGRVAGDYQDISGKTYDYSHQGTYTDPGTGVAWSYDGSTQGWTSVSEGGAAGPSGPSGPSTGTAPGGTAGSVAPSTGTAVDQQGNVWSYDASAGTWSSPTYSGTEGHTGYTDSTGTTTGGAYSAPPAGTDTGGHTSGGMTGDAGGTGGMTAGDSGGYSAPSSGDAGGSAPSGGDSGGGGTGGGDGGGGHSGGDGGGMGGYVVKEIRPAKELHPVTKFLLKYLGIK